MSMMIFKLSDKRRATQRTGKKKEESKQYATSSVIDIFGTVEAGVSTSGDTSRFINRNQIIRSKCFSGFRVNLEHDDDACTM